MRKIFHKLNRFFCNEWHLAVLDMHVGRWIIKPKISLIPYLKAENANGRHILMKPEMSIESYYLLVDDVPWPIIKCHHHYPDGTWKPGRLVVETSPANYQIWIHSVRSLTIDEKRFWLQKMHNDPGADPHNRFGRCPGFRNRKEKYRTSYGDYPLARLIWVDWMRRAEIPQLSFESSRTAPPLSLQPREGGVCQSPPITRRDYHRADESVTDFSYAVALMRRGYSDHDVRMRIISERRTWDNHRGQRKMNDYLDRTIRKARHIIKNNYSKLEKITQI